MTYIPPACRKNPVCLLEDRHAGRCQPASKHDQKKVREILRAAGATGKAGT